MSLESAGARRRVVSGEESAACGDSRETASAVENGGQSGPCSNVANPPARAELLVLVNAAIVALDAGETEVAGAGLRALAEAIRSQVTGGGRNGV
jgi:hypothetical protein